MKVSQQLFESILEEQLLKRFDDLPLLTEPISSELMDLVRHHARITVIEVLRSGVVGHLSRNEAQFLSSRVDVTVDQSRISFEASRLYTELYPPNVPSSNRRVFIPMRHQPGISTRQQPHNLPEGYHPPRGIVALSHPPANPTYDQIMAEVVSPPPPNRYVLPTAVSAEERSRILTSVPDGTVVSMQMSSGVEYSALSVGTVLYMNDDGTVTPYVSASTADRPRLRIGFVHHIDRIPGTNRPADQVAVCLSRTFEYYPVNGIEEVPSALSDQAENALREIIENVAPPASAADTPRLRGLSQDRVMIDDASDWGPSPLAEMVQPLRIQQEMQLAQQRLVASMGVPSAFLDGRDVSTGAETRLRVEEAQRMFDAGLVSREFLREVLDPSLVKLIPETEEVHPIQEPRRKIEP